ncbi:electron transfer flavoprotein subunit alpha/FixB family protein [Thermodesulfobacteriota bacterium]
MNTIVVYAEQEQDRVKEVSLELLQKAVELAGQSDGSVSAILIGCDCTPASRELVHHGANQVFVVEDDRLKLYQSDVFPRIVADTIREISPEIVLIGGTSIGMDLAPRVAAKLNTGLTAHCIDLYIECIEGRDQLIQVVPGWGGRMLLKIICPEHRPQMATVRPGVLEKGKPDDTRKGEIISLKPDIQESEFRAKTLEMVKEGTQERSLEEADIIVSGGFGLYSAGGFDLIKALADAFGGEVAGTRPAVDHGWIAENRMIGQSGKNVRPRLFISVGASGAVHYTTGFTKSNVVVAIDKNPDAPIFDVADIGVAGDLTKIVPCLIEELNKGRMAAKGEK